MSETLGCLDELIQDFVDTTVEVLSTMASLECSYTGDHQYEEIGADCDVATCLDITGILGFSGGRRGSIVVTFTNEIAKSAVGGMLGIEFEEIDSDVRDGVGELVNMIAGGAKTKLQDKGLDFELSIPNTVMGKNHRITVPAGTCRTRLDFVTSAGNFFVEVYLKKD